jgi:hypothetical protein
MLLPVVSTFAGVKTIPAVSKRLLVWVLPALLLSLTGVLFGYYYESNDDVAITQVLRGETSLEPVPNLHLYFHGLSYLLAVLYRMSPATPWFGIVLYVLLYASLVLVFHVLVNVLSDKLLVWDMVLCLTLVYWFAWQETALLMNFTRLPVLLVGAGVLYMASRGSRIGPLLIGSIAVMLGWSIRPSAAVLGLVVSIPAAWWLARFRALIPVLSAGMLLVVSTALVSSSYSPVEARYRRLDMLKSNSLDFSLYQSRPVTAADSLGVLSVENWALGDSTVVNEPLFERAFRFDKQVFLRQTILHKLFASFYVLRDYYPLLVLFPLVVALWLSFRNRWLYHWEFWLAQIAFTFLLLVISIAMKLPLRIASPMLSIWTVGSIIYVAQRGTWPLRLTGAGRWMLYGLAMFFGYTLWHDSREYRRVRDESEAYLSKVHKFAKHRTMVVAGVEWAYVYLSPFTTYELSDSPVVTLMGWLTLDPSLTELREKLTGTRDFDESLNQLATKPNVVWLLRDDFATYLHTYSLRHRPLSATVLEPVAQGRLATNLEFAQIYTMRLQPRSAVSIIGEYKPAATPASQLPNVPK